MQFSLKKLKSIEKNLEKFKQSLKEKKENSFISPKLEEFKKDFNGIIEEVKKFDKKKPLFIESFNQTKLNISNLFIFTKIYNLKFF